MLQSLVKSTETTGEERLVAFSQLGQVLKESAQFLLATP